MSIRIYNKYNKYIFLYIFVFALQLIKAKMGAHNAKYVYPGVEYYVSITWKELLSLIPSIMFRSLILTLLIAFIYFIVRSPKNKG